MKKIKFTKFNIGITLIILSFITCVINFYLLIFIVPIFIIGCIFISLSEKKIKFKILSIVTPLLLYFPATFLFLMVYNYSCPKIFLIPKNYNGKLRIIYEEKCGQQLKKEDGNEVFQFPNDEILILSEKFNGRINHKYYFVDKKGNREEIPQDNFEGKDLKFPNVSILGSGTMSNDIIKIGVASNNDKGNFSYSDFYVNHKKAKDYDFKLEQKFDSLTFANVDNCRNTKRKQP